MTTTTESTAMTTSTITVSLDGSDAVTHEADYFQHEDGWTTLKTTSGKQVAAYPDGVILGIVTSNSPISAVDQQHLSAGPVPS